MPKVSTSNRNSSLDRYLSEVNKYPTLAPEEERELARRWQEHGDQEAAQRLVTSNLRFVVKIAAEYKSHGFRFRDLIQEGNVGLLQAISRFDPERGVRLLTYAVWWIRSSILSYILRTWSLVRIGTTRSQRKLFFALRKTRRRLRALEGKEPEREELAEALDTDPETVEQMEGMLTARDTSLHAPVRDGEDLTLMDRIADEQPLPEERVGDTEEAIKVKAAFAEALAILDPRERAIIEKRHLIEQDERATLSELGEEFGVTRERVRQLESRAKRKLRDKLTSLLPEETLCYNMFSG